MSKQSDSPLIAPIDPSRQIRRRAVQIMLRDGLIVLCCLVLAEFALQRWAPEYAQHLFDAEFTGWHPVQVNADGYRGPRIDPAKSEHELRIVAVGDSVTFGTAVAAESAWPLQLAELLAAMRGEPVTAINTALPAMDLRQIRAEFERSWIEFEPDYVVLAVTGNILSLGWIRREEPVETPHNGFLVANHDLPRVDTLKTQAKRTIKRFALPSFLSLNSQRALFHIGLLTHNVDPEAPYGVLVAHGWRQHGLHPNVTEEAWARFADDLAALNDVIEAAGATLVVTYSPPRFAVSDSWRDNEKAMPRHRMSVNPCKRAAALFDQRAIAAVDALAALQARREVGAYDPLYVQFDYTHFNAEGHRVLAEAFAEAIMAEDAAVPRSVSAMKP